jgi:hypothetical protein
MANLKFVLCALLLFCISIQVFSISTSITNFPKSLINAMAQRESRYHHYLWHNIREGWNRFSNSSQDALRKLGWAPPRPGRSYDKDGVASAIPENGSGEDFLYMHRQMIAQAKDILKENKESYQLTSWSSIPAPDNDNYPVPPPYNIPGDPSLTSYTNFRKTDEYYDDTMQSMAKFLTDPVNLRNMTLSELGAKIELNIHSWMHMRWSSASSYGYRPTNKSAIPANFDKKWDDPQYNWMGDTYASHVNPYFWKLHGWVDDRIEDWRKANNLTSIKWMGTWTGGPMSSFSSILKKENTRTNLRGSSNDHEADTEEVGDVMEQALQIVLQEQSKEVSFADEVRIDLDVEPSPTSANSAEPKKISKPKSKLNQRQRSLCRSRTHGRRN